MERQISRSLYFRVVTTGSLFLLHISVALADCADRPVGVKNRYIIPDSSFTATSNSNDDHKPYHGRLNSNLYGWAAGTRHGGNDYLQIDLGLPYVICAVATQGSSNLNSWVTEYKIDTSLDDTVWTSYQDNGQPKLFPGNAQNTGNSIVKNVMKKTILRYIRFIPTAYHDWRVMRVEVYGYTQACENLPLGMQSGIIPDGNITASSAQYPAMNARLNYTSGSSWCASTSDSGPYLQIDLGSPHLICAVATQGNSITDQWVKTYQINTSSNGITWTTYQENNITRTFYGNYDRTTAVRRLLYHGVITRYLRIVPKTNQGGIPCLRTEIYGYLFQPACSSHSIGIPNSSLVPDHRFTATSEEAHNCCNPFKGRLGAIPGWLPKTDTADDYLQVDLGDVFYICAVATQGHGGNWNEWVTRYKVLYSTSNKTWTTYRDESGNEHEFNGNSDKTTVVTNSITNPFRAKFVRVFPTAYHKRKMIRIDFKGLPSGCTSSLGIENSQIPDSQMTSSSSSDSSHTASRARLYDSSSWCSLTTSNTEYIQVDLGQTKTVIGIATQGDNSLNKWVTSYKVSYSFDNRDWNEYKDGQVAKVFSGNSNKNGVIVNWFNRPIAARFVRIFPRTSNGGRHCLRFDLYGCAVFVIPKVILDTAQVILPASKGTNKTLSCSVLGEPTPDIQWFNNGTKINGTTQPALRVQFISAEDVLSKFNCTRQDPSTRAVVCNTFYTCRATYPNYVPSAGMNEVTGKVTVNLNVPHTPVVTAVPNKRSVHLNWNLASTDDDDVGSITWYTIEFNNQSSSINYHVKHPTSTFKLTYLKPYTNYSVRMNAQSYVGTGLWSAWKTFRTSIAEPEGIPSITGTNVQSSQSMTLYFKYSQLDLLHGPMAGFRVYYKPEGGTQQYTDVGNVTMTTLSNLRKYTNYTLSVAVRNNLYVGSASTTTRKQTLEDVPDIGPQNTRATKINDTTFLVAWQPLTTHQSNGVVTKYEINWSFLVGRSRRSLQEITTATTQGTQYTMYNLSPCVEYTVHVRGYTRIGPGPNSTTTFFTTPPGEPYSVQAQSPTKTTITLTWKKPSPASAVVDNYTIEVKGSKTYWAQYNFLRNYTQGGRQTSLVIRDLLPGTSYEFWVMAKTDCGQSNRSESSKMNTAIDKPVKPVGKSVTLRDKYGVPLYPVEPQNGPISSYQVIVIKGNFGVNDLPTKIGDSSDAKEYYITAELKPNELRSPFTIGDNKNYGKHKNVELQKGKTYTIAERAITIDKDAIYASDAAVVATIEVTQEKTGGSGGQSGGISPVGPAVGAVIAVLLILAMIILLIFIKRRRRPEDLRKESTIPLDDFETETGNVNNGEDVQDQNNVADAIPDDIYDEAIDNEAKPIPVRQFAEYMNSMKSTEYVRLKEEYKKIPSTHAYSKTFAKKPVNKKKNRYGNVIPYDHSRVAIERTGEDKDSDYINASYIRGYDGTKRHYIASQGPVEESCPDFWQMIWEQNTCTIVMLTNLKELSKIKCHQYWPEAKETYRDITVNNHKTEVFPDYIIRTFVLTQTNTEEKRRVLQFHFTVWPDKGVPHYATAVLGLRRKVKAMNPQNAGPVVVHCSAGIGRTGCYIVIDAMLEQAKKLRNVEISNYVTKIRKDRVSMVQTDEQYIFIHMAILEALTCGNTEIQAHNLQTTLKKLSTTNPPKNATGYALEFERLNSVTSDYAKEECDVGQSKENASKNRYPSAVALNQSRVQLTREDTTTTDYINASFVHAYRERNAFIVTQAPLQNTIEDFWIMVVNYHIRTIVMLNSLQEENEQFPQYWPQEGSETHGDVTVELLDTRDNGDVIARSLQVSYRSSSISVQHLQHLKWPDKSIPANPQTVLDLLNEVEQSQRQSNNTTPVVVQCSNGVGRSGTFCAISSILERMKQEQVIDVFQVVKCIRSNRPGAVESLTQYIFCYQIIQKYLDSFSDYANFSNC